jgi:hypothetical protein
VGTTGGAVAKTVGKAEVMNIGRDRGVTLQKVAALVLCAAAGLTEWSLLVVGRPLADTLGGTLFLGTLATAVLAGLVIDQHAVNISAAIHLGPFVAAGWTQPRGSDDGLWVLIFPFTIVQFVLGAGLVAVARRLFRDPHRRRTASTSRPWRLAAMAIAATLASVLLLLERRADPFPGLERVAAGYSPPPGFVRSEVHRQGNPLASGGNGATLETIYTGKIVTDAACRSAEASLRAWQNTTWSVNPYLLEGPPSRELCSWWVQQENVGGHLGVGNESDGATVVVLTIRADR